YQVLKSVENGEIEVLKCKIRKINELGKLGEDAISRAIDENLSNMEALEIIEKVQINLAVVATELGNKVGKFKKLGDKIEQECVEENVVLKGYSINELQCRINKVNELALLGSEAIDRSIQESLFDIKALQIIDQVLGHLNSIMNEVHQQYGEYESIGNDIVEECSTN
ncbi:MAG: hypothetical protein KAQ98_08130, partial [Bacteriovoracaceae bacterium]|nr:hypothetical protein [Bacteriovoracaceae bacterium]